MRKLFGASIKLLYRDRQTLFWALMFPVLFAVVFGLFDFDDAPEVNVAVVRAEPGPVSQALVAGLRQFESFTVTERTDLAAARKAIVDGDLDVVVAVPPAPPGAASVGSGGSAGGPISVLYNEGNVNENRFALSAVRQIVDRLNLELAGVSRPPLALRSEGVAGKAVDYYDFLLPGLVAMGLMNVSIIGMAVAVTRFREQQILKRILATPLAPWRFLVAQVAARLLLALTQAAVLLAVGVFLFGAHVYGNVGWIFALAVLGNLIFLNIGFAIAGRAPNSDAAQGMGQAIAVPMMFLSGVFFPLESLPSVVERVVRHLPLTPLIEALRAVSLDGRSITATGPQLLELGAWAVVLLALAARSFRFSSAR
ncbi:MAG TPA: ABC transporter permease [Actinomycetota bacterium]|nr:ABC transporter permease [Actinomycetota bacterium]